MAQCHIHQFHAVLTQSGLCEGRETRANEKVVCQKMDPREEKENFTQPPNSFSRSRQKKELDQHATGLDVECVSWSHSACLVTCTTLPPAQRIRCSHKWTDAIHSPHHYFHHYHIAVAPLSFDSRASECSADHERGE